MSAIKIPEREPTKDSARELRDSLIAKRRKWKKFGQAANDKTDMFYIDRETRIQLPDKDVYNRVIFDGTSWIFSGILPDKSEQMIRELADSLDRINKTDTNTKSTNTNTTSFASKFANLNNSDLDEQKHRNERTVFIRGFLKDYTFEDLTVFFHNTLPCKFNKIKMVNDNHTGEFRGIVFLELRSATDVPKVIHCLHNYKLNNILLCCRSAVDLPKYYLRS